MDNAAGCLVCGDGAENKEGNGGMRLVVAKGNFSSLLMSMSPSPPPILPKECEQKIRVQL